MKTRTLFAGTVICCVMAIIMSAGMSSAAEVKILLPLGRVAYQTNEQIDVSVLRTAAAALAANDLVLTVSGADGSRMAFTFPAPAAAVVANQACSTEHLHLNGWLLRPGNYMVEAAVDGATASAKVEVYSHIRRSTFKLFEWGSRAKDHEQAVLGEDSVGFNLNYAYYGGLNADELIRAGVDYMWCCTMSGGAQMDLRKECDWSDPYVLGGGQGRLAWRAFRDRTNPNCIGVHFYDEPTLTKLKHPGTGENVPFNVPAQDRSYRAAFGREPIQYNNVKLDDPQSVSDFKQMNRWRLSLLDAAWKMCKRTVTQIEPTYLTANQGSWLFSGFGVGYYFNYQRSLPIYSGHGGYDYLYGGHFAPSWFFEFGRARDYAKPQWYLPMWGCGHNDLWRCEQYLSFQNNLQGMAAPPDVLVHRPSKTPVAASVVESNKAMARLGTIFTAMPVTKPPVAVLFSLSHNLQAMTANPKDTYLGDGQFQKLEYVYMAAKMIHVPIFPIVEEDVLDGTLAADHRVLILAGTNYLEPAAVKALEAFITDGGAVLASADSKVQIRGAATFEMPAEFLTLFDNWQKWGGEGKWDLWNDAVVTHAAFRAARPLAAILKTKLDKLGIKPVFECEEDGIIASRQAAGDIEYIFAVNASPDFNRQAWYMLRTAETAIELASDGRPIYDAMLGGAVPELGKRTKGTFRFGPGQMRVFARTARPIASVSVVTPVVKADFTKAAAAGVEIAATIADGRGQAISGSAPLRIEVVDPLKSKRFDMYRATECGVFRASLPLAANDPAGEWTVTVRELLNNTEGKAAFAWNPPKRCGAVAGATQRAVCFDRDAENVFRFFRTHKNVVIVKGASDYNNAQADRLAAILKPWDVRCKIVPAADAAKPRELSPEMAPTWVGWGGREPDFAVEDPAILLGTPDDNPLIKFLAERGYLPYKPAKDQFPGRGRGMLAWQTDAIRFFDAESITLIAYDEAGMAEAVGTLYEAMAGIEPLTPLAQPTATAAAAGAANAPRTPEAAIAWQTVLPDRPVALKVLSKAGALVLTDDGTLSSVSGRKIAWQKTFAGGEEWALDASPDASLIAVGVSTRVIGLNAKGKQVFDVPLAEEKYPPGIGLVAVSPDGQRVLVSGGINNWLSGWHWDGRLRMLNAKGETVWTMGGDDPESKKPVVPKPVAAALFSADGSKVILFTATEVKEGKETKEVKEAQIRDAATGKVLATAAGANGAVTPLLLGDRVLASDGAGKLITISIADGKLSAQGEMPDAGIVAIAPFAGGFAVGTEADGTVRLVKAADGKLEDQTVWKDAVHTKIVKKIAASDSSVAVSYWGGTVRVFDPAGKLRCEQMFTQDVAVMDWFGRDLLVGLADGRLIALENISR